MMNLKGAALSIAAAAALAGSASADVTVPFTNVTFTGFNFTQLFNAGQLTGTLTGVSVNAVLNASVNFTYADDLCIYVDDLPLSLGGLLQVGGFSNTGAAERHFWANGGSDVPGTTVIDTVTLTNPLNMDTLPIAAVWLGNGYGASGTSGTWTGSVTLHGVTEIPAPGALALLGLGGLAAARRRRN
ncbi:MAG: PEP-CTERM sorting domain-containing protein [Phycisphaeraceae bacterium]|nr:PEP-CTERM sorting domain-containing protein [Phycisphaeraceae bacterium]